MSDPLGLSVGTTNLVAARVGNQPVTRRSVLTLPDGAVLGGFVERVGDSVPLIAADGTAHSADRMLAAALAALITDSGGPSSDIAVAVPAHWRPSKLWALRTAMRDEPALAPNGTPVRLVSDAVASLTALHAEAGLPAQGVVVLLDFGGGGTSITVADAAAGFEPIDETTRYAEFSGDLLDQALLRHVLDGIATTGEVDPAGTAAVESLTRLREDCRAAKERLSTAESTELAAALPGYRSTIRITRSELEALIAAPLAGVLSALDMLLQRNNIGRDRVAAVASVGGGAAIPLIGERLAGHASVPVITTPQPALDAAIGAGLLAAYGSAAEAQTGLAPVASAGMDAPGSSTFRALAWSQDDVAADDPVPFTEPYEPYEPDDTDVASTRSPVQYVPATGPIDEPRAWQRLPGSVFGLAAAVALIAVGGVAIALTSATGSTEPNEPPRRAPSAPATSAAPPPSPQVQTVTVTSVPPLQTTRAPQTTAPPVTTTAVTTTTTPTTTTTTPMTTTYLPVPFLPVPIPIQVPGG